MKTLLSMLTELVGNTFTSCGYNHTYGQVTLSNRPDLCQFQCNGALAAAKAYKKSPMLIAKEVVEHLQDQSYFETIQYIAPGFINITLQDDYLVSYLNTVALSSQFGCTPIENQETVIIDYGGANIAKPLHIGHLRTAIIGESLKRMYRFLGYNVLGDVHLGDWGLQIGLIIAEVKKRHPELPYFDASYKEDYPNEAPFTISELKEIYPVASSYAKEHPEFMSEAKNITFLFQQNHPGYKALWQQILKVSIDDLKKNYTALNVHFDLWKKESDAQPYIPKMIENLKELGLAYENDGAVVVDIKEDADTREMPPCILVKSDGATLYSTTDLATLIERKQLFNPNEVIYIVDKRQSLHFEQVFRTARKAELIPPTTKLTFLGFGTMNGTDGKPFKTRSGGVMRLEQLIEEVHTKVYAKVAQNKAISKEEALIISKQIGLAALKYGDLSNQISKDYVFDLERFTSFEGNTGPYLLYTAVRMSALLEKASLVDIRSKIDAPSSEMERALMLKLALFNELVPESIMQYSPHKLCQYLYELCNLFNRFYHEHKILTESNISKQQSWLKLTTLCKEMLVTGLDLLGIEVPHKM